MVPALQALIAQLPNTAVPFSPTQFPFPVSQVLFGGSPDLARLRQEAAELEASEAEPHQAAWIVLSAAEAVESVQADREQYFIPDGTFRGMVFTGIKWRAGWALLMGDGQEDYARAFSNATFLVYTTRSGIEIGRFLGDRETSAIYFAQLLARYALLYSDVEPGEGHDLGHFIEDHGPGVLVVTGRMGPIESLLCLSLMRLGMRAVVTAAFPWEMGDRVEVDSPAEAVAACAQFENLRIRSQTDPLSALPEYANPAYAHQEFEPARRLGGTENSFVLLRRGKAEEGVCVIGQPEHDIGLLVAVDDDTLDAPAAAELGAAACGYLDLLDGLRVESAEPLTLALRDANGPSAEQMAEVVRRGLRLECPRLGPVQVMVLADPGSMAEEVRQVRASRATELQRRREADMTVVYGCEACAPFSREHICLVHRLRSPMCGRRWTEMLVGARYMAVSAGRPWRRRGRPENCCTEIPLGRALDPRKGEYQGLNEFVSKATEGRMRRVFLHSVRDFPHSSCGCFYGLAWWSEELGGIAIMHRGFEGAAPDGSSWMLLANRAGGKQQPGITGVGLEYMKSPLFLQGDGGWGAVKWITHKLQNELRQAVPQVADIRSEAG